MKRHSINAVVALGLGLGLTLALLFLLTSPLPARADPSILYVATDGDDANDCSTIADRCRTVQRSVDLAATSDEIRVAGGAYTDTDTASLGYVATLTKTVMLRGGWDASFTTQNFTSTPTILDAMGQGRVLYITGEISSTIEGLRITGGDATGLGDYEVGGGLYVVDATFTLSACQVFSNTAYDGGGGLYASDSVVTLISNTITANTVVYNYGVGGGLSLSDSVATVENNSITANTGGGGLYLASSTAKIDNNTIAFNNGSGLDIHYSNASLNSNTIHSNTAAVGGGLYVRLYSTVTLRDNMITSNTATGGDGGGGLLVYLGSAATLSGNTFISNTADYIGGGVNVSRYSSATLESNIFNNNTANWGGGVHIRLSSNAALSGNTFVSNTAGSGGAVCTISSDTTLNGNTLFSNTARIRGGGLYISGVTVTLSSNTVRGNAADYGGGLYLNSSAATLIANTVIDNSADYGGGLFLTGSDATLINHIIADNQLHYSFGSGSGLYILGSSPRLYHTTIARNIGGLGRGISIINDGSDYSTVALTNTILVSHAVGIYAMTGNTATLESTLWNGNTTDWSGGGTINRNNDYSGAPAFVDPDSGDYHIDSTSAAREAGIDAGVGRDIDEQIRPMDWRYDIGADEYPGVGLDVVMRASAVFLNPDQVFTYTITITNVGRESATGVVITDTLDTWQRAAGAASSMGSCTLADAGWGGTVVCSPGTMISGTTVLVTLTAQVSTTVMVGQAMTNTVVVTANETTNSAYAVVYGQDCHARINDAPAEYTGVQAAGDAADPGDLVKVAGVCLGASQRRGMRQQVYLSKSLTIRGGYTTTNWTTSDPTMNATVLNALGQGRVFYIVGSISPTIEGLQIIGGDATGMGGYIDWWDAYDVGGGMYIGDATATISSCTISSNLASSTRRGYGGGLYLDGSTANLNGTTVVQDNIASTGGAGSGGGIALSSSATVHLSGATVVQDNTASTAGTGSGGGLYLDGSTAHLTDTQLIGNIASTENEGSGGGLYLGHYSSANLNRTLLASNTASVGEDGFGGGLHIIDGSMATLTGTQVVSNTASTSGTGYGGGLYTYDHSTVTLTDTEVTSNTASTGSAGYGGGLYLDRHSPANLNDTWVVSNTASTVSTGYGGGLYAYTVGSTVNLSDGTVVRGNRASTGGAGYGGGLHLSSSTHYLGDTTVVQGNIASIAGIGYGGGLYLTYAQVNVSGATVQNNTASTVGPGYGGGFSIQSDSTATLNDITYVQSNTASTGGVGHGGGLHLDGSTANLNDAQLVSNTASSADTGFGGGLYLYDDSTANLNNTQVLSNTASSGGDGSGGGFYLDNSTVTLDSATNIRGGTASTAGTGNGGGFFLGNNSSAAVVGAHVVSNTASTGGDGFGGGFYLDSSTVNLDSAAGVKNNVASTTSYGSGGGLYFRSNSTANMTDTRVVSNIASKGDGGSGGGLYISGSTANLTGAFVQDNAASTVGSGSGGGLYVSGSTVNLGNATVQGNTAGAGDNGSGGGFYLIFSTADLISSTVQDNTANTGIQGEGGGLYLHSSAITLKDARVMSNTANTVGFGYGGGLCLWSNSTANLTDATVQSNTASIVSDWGHGDGVYADSSTLGSTVAVNSVIIHNAGEGLYFDGGSHTLVNDTLSDNNLTGAIVNDGTLILTNTIVAGHDVGIERTAGTIIASYTLFSNTIDIVGTVTNNNPVYGDPRFMDAAGGNYHLGASSPAIDQGDPAGTAATGGPAPTADFDGEARPVGMRVDVGADEFPAGLRVTKQASSDPVLTGALLTYSLGVTNTGNVTLTAIITDLLPDHVVPTGVLTWTPIIPVPGGVWTETVVVTVEIGYAGPLTNVVRITTEEGATGTYTRTVTVTNTPPTLSGIPNQVFDHVTPLTNTIDLWDYAWDAETNVSALTYTLETIPPTGAGVVLDANRYITVTPSPDWCGYTDVTVRATDPGGLWGSDTFRVAVTWSCQGPPPVPDQAARQDEPITLDLTSYEPEGGNDLAALRWYVTGEDHCTVSGEYSAHDVLTFTPEPGLLGGDMVTLHMAYPWAGEW